VHPLSLGPLPSGPVLLVPGLGPGAAGGLRSAQPPLLARLPGLLAELNMKLGPVVENLFTVSW